MPYTTPPNFVAGDIATEAQLDTLSDDIAFLAGPARCRLRAVASQTVPSGAATAITWDVEDYDTDAMHSSATTSRITFNTAGVYDLKGGVLFGTNTGGGERTLEILKNGTTTLAHHIGSKTPNGVASLTIVTDSAFVVGDYVQLRAFQDSGVELSVHDAQRSFFSARWASL